MRTSVQLSFPPGRFSFFVRQGNLLRSEIYFSPDLEVHRALAKSL